MYSASLIYLRPISSPMLNNISTSDIYGIFLSIICSSERQAAAIKGNELFLEPGTFIVPLREVFPLISIHLKT